MNIEPMASCEVEIDGEWRVIEIAEALASYKGFRMRCCACRGQVVPQPAYRVGGRAHFSHVLAFTACKKIPSFDQPLHPKAVF
jgi:hypothetical protein